MSSNSSRRDNASGAASSPGSTESKRDDASDVERGLAVSRVLLPPPIPDTQAILGAMDDPQNEEAERREILARKTRDFEQPNVPSPPIPSGEAALGEDCKREKIAVAQHPSAAVVGSDDEEEVAAAVSAAVKGDAPIEAGNHSSSRPSTSTIVYYGSDARVEVARDSQHSVYNDDEPIENLVEAYLVDETATSRVTAILLGWVTPSVRSEAHTPWHRRRSWRIVIVLGTLLVIVLISFAVVEWGIGGQGPVGSHANDTEVLDDLVIRTYCSSESCNQHVWDAVATDSSGNYSCGERITYLQHAFGQTEGLACARVSFEFPGVCLCDPPSWALIATPQTPQTQTVVAPTANGRVHCGCAACTQDVWDANATDAGGSYSCGSRIEWLQTQQGYEVEEACATVASEFPYVCPCLC